MSAISCIAIAFEVYSSLVANYFALLKTLTMVLFSLVGDRLEGPEAGSRKTSHGAAVQSAAAHVPLQLGPALFYTLLHGRANIDASNKNLYLQVCPHVIKCHNAVSCSCFVRR